MRTVALRGLVARRTRLALTALAVALGVMLIAGTYVFTDTINRSFDRIFTVSYAPVDVALTPNGAIANAGGDLPPIDAAVLARVRGLPGVAAGQGSIFSQGATVIGSDGSR